MANREISGFTSTKYAGLHPQSMDMAECLDQRITYRITNHWIAVFARLKSDFAHVRKVPLSHEMIYN